VEEFLQLSSCQLVALIRRDHLNVREERDVYSAILKVGCVLQNILTMIIDDSFIFSGFEVTKNTDGRKWKIF
jgi:hypothetical protein